MAPIAIPATEVLPETGIFGVAVVGVAFGGAVAPGGGVFVGPVEMRQSSEDAQTLLLSRT